MHESRRGHRREPSILNGWLTKLRGHVTFNQHLVRYGRREMEDARAYRDTKNERKRRHGDRSRREDSGEYDSRGRRRSSSRPQRFLHFPHRCRPTYHGAHFRLMGLFTRRKEHISRGLAMQEEADRERRRERRRRQRELAEEGLAVRLGAKTVLHPRDSHRHRRHGHRREDSGIPIMHAADVTHDHPNGHGVHIVRPGSMRHGYGRHNAIPVMRSEGGRHAYYDDGGVPIMRSEGSHPSHRNTDPVIPVARSTSRHDQRYAGSQAGHGLRRSSRHGQRHHRSH